MAKKTNYLQVKISDSLKEQFEAMCNEREMSMSDVVRDLVANSVRNYKRQAPLRVSGHVTDQLKKASTPEE